MKLSVLAIPAAVGVSGAFFGWQGVVAATIGAVAAMLRLAGLATGR